MAELKKKGAKFRKSRDDKTNVASMKLIRKLMNANVKKKKTPIRRGKKNK